MATLSATDFADLVAGTLRDLGRNKWTQIAQSQQRYPIFTRWFKGDHIVLQSGIGIQRTIVNRLPDAARHVGMASVDNVNIFDLLDQIQVPWVHAETSWAVIYQEALMNRGAALVTNIIEPRRKMAAINLIEELENKAWSAPASSSDTLYPWGIPYWIVKNATTGFNGGAPSGHTTVGGVSLTDSPTFKNYTFTFAASGGISKTDAIPKMRTAMRQCYFVPAVPTPGYAPAEPRYCLYVNNDTIATMEGIGESQNENLGRDLAPKQYGYGQLVFRGVPIEWSPNLDSDTTNPIYGIDHNSFGVYGLQGNWFRESRNMAPLQHNVEQYFQDVTYNYVCVNRRTNFVGYGV